MNSEPKKTTTEMMTNPWRIYLIVGIVGLCIVSITGYSLFIIDPSIHKYSSQIDATLKAELEATTAHLWLEEILSGDRYESIQAVLGHLDKSEWYIHALLEGDQDSDCDYFALTETLLRKQAEQALIKLAEFRSIAEKRFASPEASVAGTDIDQQFDEVFRVFLKETEDLEGSIRDTMNREQARFHAIQYLLIVITAMLALLISVVLHCFSRRRTLDLLALREVNKNLTKEVSDRKQAEERLEQVNQQLQTSIEQMPAAYILWDNDFRALEWNNAAEEIFGYTREETLGKSVTDLIVPEPIRHLIEEVLEKLRNGESVHYSEKDNNIIIFKF